MGKEFRESRLWLRTAWFTQFLTHKFPLFSIAGLHPRNKGQHGSRDPTIRTLLTTSQGRSLFILFALGRRGRLLTRSSRVEISLVLRG